MPPRFLSRGMLIGLVAMGVTAVVFAAEAPTERLALLARLVHDPSPKTRLEALRALAKIKSAESATLALSVLEAPMDPTLDYGLWLTINDLAEPFVEALRTGAWKPEGRDRQLEFALQAIPPQLAGRVLGQILATHPLDRVGTGPWIELIGQAGSAEQLRMLFDLTTQGQLETPAVVRALAALGEAARLRQLVPPGDLGSLAALYGRSVQPESVRVAALQLVGQWKKHGDWVSSLVTTARDSEAPVPVQRAAFEALRMIAGKESIAALTELSRQADPKIARSAILALAGLDLAAATPFVVEQAKTMNEETVALDFWRSILSVKGAARAITDALPPQGLQPVAARSGMRAAREGGRSDLDLVVALARGAGLTTGDTAASADLIKELAAKALAQGNPYRGEWVFRRNETACLTCHGIGGAGGKVGPDLTSIGASAPPDYLVESILMPSAKIKEGYHAVVVTTKDGTEHTGTLARETPNEMVLRLASGAEEAISKNEVQKREQGVNSLMPAGLLESLNAQEQLDLFAFLSRLGKPGDFDAAKGGVARRWHLTQTVHTDGQAGQEYWPLTSEWTDSRWQHAYALVQGIVTKSMVIDANGGQAWTSRLAFYAATEFSLIQPGTVDLKLTAGPGADLWVDGKKYGSAGVSHMELPAGIHRAVIQIDPKNVPESIRLDSSDVSFVLD